MFKIKIIVFGHEYDTGAAHMDYAQAMEEACLWMLELKQDGICAACKVSL